jgi:hypothetical protein
MRLGWASPDPGLGMTIEVLGGDTGDEGNIVLISQRLPREGLAPEDAPPSLDQIEPRGTHRNKGVLDARMGFEPLPDGTTGVAGQVIGNQVEVASRIGAVQRLEQVEVARRVAGTRGLGQRLAVADREGSIDPDLRRSPVIVEGDLDAVAIGRPARSGWEIAGRYGPEFVDTQDRGAWGRGGVEADDAGSFGTKSGSLLLAHNRVCRHRIPSCR